MKKTVRRLDVQMRLIGRLMFRLVDNIENKQIDQRQIGGIRLHLSGVEHTIDRLERERMSEVKVLCAETRTQITLTRSALDDLEAELVPRKPN